jgi:bifunctional non-homologous end joining protein LigD
MVGRSHKNDYSSNYPEIVAEIRKINHDFIMDGELTFFQNGRPVFLTALATPESKTKYKVKYMTFDLLEINGRNLMGNSTLFRLEMLQKLIPSKMYYIKVVKTHYKPETFHTIYDNIVNVKKGEGVVIKHVNAPYIEDHRGHWIKIKKVSTEDCVVCGITHGTGARESTFGALILGQYENGKLRFVGKCSGFDVATMNEIYKNVRKMPETSNYLGVNIPKASKFVKPIMVVEVMYMQRTPNGMLRHPRFIRIRTDKLPGSCVIRRG